MPKYLDLIYRVKDEASAALAKVRRAQDDTGKSAGSLRQTLKSLKSTWTELKSIISLAQQALGMYLSVTFEAAKAWETYTIAQGNATRATEAQYRQALLAKQLEEERRAIGLEWGKIMSGLIIQQQVQIKLLIEEGKLHSFNSQAVQDEIDRRLSLVDVIRDQSRETRRLSENQLIAKAAASFMEGRNAQAQWYIDQAAAVHRANGELAAYIRLAENALNMQLGPLAGTVMPGGKMPSGGKTPVPAGAPRLQGNTQADLDRYNREYRTWVNR
jgi:hypothetical protein